MLTYMISDAHRNAWYACKRLMERFGKVGEEHWNSPRGFHPEAGVMAVARTIESERSVNASESERSVNASDARAGLLLIPLTRRAFDVYEYDLICYAPSAD